MSRRHEARVHLRHLAVYGVMLAVVALVGGFAIWSFVEQQSLVIAPDRLPKVTIVTQDARSPLAAAWVKLLTEAELQPTLVPLEKFDPIEGVVVFCDIPSIPPKLAELLAKFLDRGGAVAFVGNPPATAIGKFQLSADSGLCDGAIRLSEAVSPVLARLNPGYEIASRRVEVAYLKESPRMVIDARWKESARAALMHVEEGGARFLWCGFDPSALPRHDDHQLMLLMRTAFRWAAGQPVSDGAVGPLQLVNAMAPAARREAREERFAFSVDRMRNPQLFSVWMTNRGAAPLENPTVKIWLPPGVTEVELAGNMIMRRNATLSGVPEEGACLVTLRSLTRNEDRVMKLRIVAARRQVAGLRGCEVTGLRGYGVARRESPCDLATSQPRDLATRDLADHFGPK